MEECWFWARSVNHAGYGSLMYKRKRWLAHRFVYEALVGTVPDGYCLDHICRNRVCINPNHLEVVTSAENTRRGEAGKITGAKNKAKTHCPQGHEYSPTNTYVWHKRPNNRMCILCQRARVRRLRRRIG